MKIEHIPRLIIKVLLQFVFIVRQVRGYRNILKLSCADYLLLSHVKLS